MAGPFSIDAVDAHMLGQHGRVVFGGIGHLAPRGTTLFDKMRHLEANGDWFRRLMLREPRGYPLSCCNIVLPPCDPRADAAFIILEQQRTYPTMSGSNLIIVATVLLESGRLPMREPVTDLLLEAPAGLVAVRATCAAGRVTSVSFRNVPCFVATLDVTLDVAGVGRVAADIAFGGMAYAVVRAEDLGVAIEPGCGRRLLDLGLAVADAARRQCGFAHPCNPDIAEIEGTVIRTAPSAAGGWRQTTVTIGGMMDRTPAGTGTSAAVAALHARGGIAPGATVSVEGMFGQALTCRVAEEVTLGDRCGIVPEITGRAWITGFARYVLQDDDPFPEGLMVGDIWAMGEAGSAAAEMGHAVPRRAGPQR